MINKKKRLELNLMFGL